MMFNLFIKTCFFVILLLSLEANSAKNALSMGRQLKNNLIKNTKIAPNGYRFQDYESMNKIKEKNIYLLSAEVKNGKPPAAIDEDETDVWPQKSNAGSEYKWTYLWSTLMHFPSKNALKADMSYWLSTRGREHDHWEAVFNNPQKIDVMDIYWRLPPKRFRVFYKLDERSEYIPVTEVYEKTSHVNSEGKVSSKNSVSEHNAIVFHKPIFARRVRINMNEPLKSKSFSIYSVRFYQKKTNILIKNELIDESQHFCLTINTNLPRPNTKVEAYPCLKSLTMQNNNELWTFNNDSSITHLNSKLCLGFDVENDLVIKKCGGFRPAYTVRFRDDNTLFFKGYKDKCIVIDQSKKVSSNFLDDATKILVTSQADHQTFKIANIKFTGDNIWHSAPDQKKASIQILFGKITSGPHKGKYENKKLDTILIDWIKQPKKFMVYTWKPGFSWILRQTYTDYISKVSEIALIGEEAAAIMLVLAESHSYLELGYEAAYAIKEVTITYNSMKLKNDNCSNYTSKVKIFDFDTQKYKKLQSVKEYTEIRKKMSISFEKIIAAYTRIMFSLKGVLKAKLKSQEFIKILDKLRKEISKDAIKKMRAFKSGVLTAITNSVFNGYLNSKGASSFTNSISSKKSGNAKIGTKEAPGVDCLSIKKLQRNSLSGWYYIKGDCSPKILRVFCDFTIFGDAVDIFVYNDDSSEPNPDLSYLNIQDFNSIRFQCAKEGLHPLQINNAQTVGRVFEVITAMGYNLSKAIVIPLGYDYTCNGGRCAGIISSLNERQTPSMTSFFTDAGKKGGNVTKPGRFAGLGYSDKPSMISFDPKNVVISAIICSTNHFQTNSRDSEFKTISCDSSAASNGDIFQEGSSILIQCPSSCNQSSSHVYGTNQYHVKSSVCKSALHASIIGALGGKVYVRVGKGIDTYLGTVANGIKSEDRAGKDGMNSFALLAFTPKCPIDQYKALLEAENGIKESTTSFLETEYDDNLDQVRVKFESDLNNNELEGVDKDDLLKAGEKASSGKMETMMINDSDEESNNNNNIDNNSIDNTDDEESSHKLNISSDSNEANNMLENNLSNYNIANHNNEAITNTEDASSSNNMNDDTNTEPEATSRFNQLEAEAEAENGNTGDSKRDRLTSEGSAQKQALKMAGNLMGNINLPSTKMAGNLMGNMAGNLMGNINLPSTKMAGNVMGNMAGNLMGNIKLPSTTMADDMMGNINKASTEMANMAGEALKGLIPSGRTPPSSDPENPLPQAPKPGQTNPPEPEDEPERLSNTKAEPTSDEGNKIMMKIRDAVDWSYLKEVNTKTTAIKERIKKYRKEISWSIAGSNLSVPYIKQHFGMIEKFKSKVMSIIKKLSSEALNRVLKTKKLKNSWRDELNKLMSKDVFKIDYALPLDVLLKKVLINLDAKSPDKSNWDLHKEGLKDRARALGITSKINSKQIIASILQINGQEYFDSKLSVDILVKANGICGVAFRMKDQFNYYAFYIDKMRGVKAIAVIDDGKTKILKEVFDGGVLINNWHRIEVVASAGNIRVFMYDLEQPNKTASEKILEVVDFTFTSGSSGVFVNNMEGFFFDNLTVTPATCWTPWIPIKDLHVQIPLSSVYYEDFSGTLLEKYILVEPEESIDGSGEWSMNQFASKGKPQGFNQKSIAYDKSSFRRPSMVIKTEKYISNGIISVSFTPKSREGTVSIVFKYMKAGTSEMFYLFDLKHSLTNPQFGLRLFNNGIIKKITSINKVDDKVHSLGYRPNVLHKVQIEILAGKIKIRLSINNTPFSEIIDVRENSIAYGLVGVGTYKVKCSFSNFEIFPPFLSLTDSQKSNILSTDSDGVFLFEQPADPESLGFSKVSEAMKKVNDLLKLGKKGGQNDVTALKTEDFTRGDAGDALGWKTCAITNTDKDRKKYCERNFALKASKERCEKEFCDSCCDSKVDLSHKNTLYLCKKTCNRSSQAQSTTEDYRSVCIQSENPSTNIYEFCESKMKEKADEKKTCKLDMCNLCCSTLDIMKKTLYSIDTMKKCFEDCGKEFNKTK